MKLKNLFGMAAMAALVLSGCSSDEVVENFSPENAIQFGTYIGHDAQSRVAEFTTGTMQKTGFGVFANYSGTQTGIEPNFMNNEDVHWTANAEDATKGEWTYSPVKYWPNTADHVVSFWAYAPYSADNTKRESLAPSFDIKDGVDFVAVAEPVKSAKQAVSERVVFKLDHMMSRIGFKVEAIVDQLEHEKGDDGENDETGDDATNAIADKTKIVVTNVKLEGILDQEGSMTWEEDEDGSADWALERTEATTSTTYELTQDNFEGKNSYPCEWDYTQSKAKDYVTGKLVSKTKEQLNNKDSYWMVIPQEDKKIKITVVYNVITEDTNLAKGYSNVENTVVSEEFDFTFERGKAYDFVLHLGLTSVKFEATVNNWNGTVNDVIVNVPINTEKTESTTTPTTPDSGEGGQGFTGGQA